MVDRRRQLAYRRGRQLPRLAAALGLALLALASLMAGVTAQEPALGITLADIDSREFPTVSLRLAVTAGGEPVTDLRPAEVKLLEDGQLVPAEALTLTPAEIDNVHLVLALDTSMAPADFEQLKAGATALAGQITNQDDLALLSFADRAEVVHGFTNNQAELQRVITEDLRARGSATAVHQAIVAATELLDPDLAGRQAVIIVTDRHHNTPGTSLAEVIAQAQQTNVPFYIVGFSEQVRVDHPLKTAILATGGQYLTVAGAAQVPATLEQLWTQLRQGYQLSFVSQRPADNEAHPLIVRLTHQGRAGVAVSQFLALPGPVEVRLPQLTDELRVSGPLDLTPEVKARGAIALIRYDLDGSLLHQIEAPPFEYTWDSRSVAAGAHRLTVTVTDQAGNTGQAEQTLNLAAPLTLSPPVLPDTVRQGTLISLTPDLQTPVDLTRVALLWGEKTLMARTVLPYNFELDTSLLATGTQTLTLRAEDRLGQVAEASFPLTVLPAPNPSRLERLGQSLGYRHPATFVRHLNRLTDGLALLLAVGLSLAILAGALLATRRIVAAQRLKARRRYLLDIANVGNVASGYELWGEDPAGLLKFEFVLHGDRLSRRSTRQMLALPGPAAGSTPVGLNEPEPVRATPPGSVPSAPPPRSEGSFQTAARQAGQVGRQVGIATRTVAGVLSAAGRLLGPLGRPLRQLSGQMIAGQSAAQRLSQQPAQNLRQVQQIQRQVHAPAPAGSPKPGGASPQDQRPQSAPSAPAGAPPGPTPGSAVKPPPGNSYHTEVDPAQTPFVEPGRMLTVEVWLWPPDPYRSRSYDFTIFSQSLAAPRHTLIAAAGRLRLVGLTGPHRFLPLATTALIGGLLLGAVLFLAGWLASWEWWQLLA